MRGCVVFFICVMCYVLPARAQQDTIHWTAAQAITWKDYIGNTMRLPDNSTIVAGTHSGIRLDLKSADRYSYNLYIYAVLNRRLSCTKCDTSLYLLNHERNHFNLTEICARRLRRDLINSRFTGDDVQQQITKIYNFYSNQLNQMQDDYDSQTRHSLDRNRQAVWDRFITQELDNLKDYARPRVVIYLRQ